MLNQRNASMGSPLIPLAREQTERYNYYCMVRGIDGLMETFHSGSGRWRAAREYLSGG